MSIRKPY